MTHHSFGQATIMTDNEIQTECKKASLKANQTNLIIAANRYFGTDKTLELVKEFQRINTEDERGRKC